MEEEAEVGTDGQTPTQQDSEWRKILLAALPICYPRQLLPLPHWRASHRDMYQGSKASRPDSGQISLSFHWGFYQIRSQ